MKLSQYCLPVVKDTTDDSRIASHKLMIKAGMISQVSSGLYAWLPFGLKVLQNITKIIQKRMGQYGFHEILMPVLQPSHLWELSGRYESYGLEMLKTLDRHDKTLIFGPTAEEVVTFLAQGIISSYKQLPMSLYNVQWKFRDEIRPRFGVMRSREFLMLDSYSFDADEAHSKESYYKHYECFMDIFSDIGVNVIPMQADTGEIGGDLSHEFSILADSGENEVVCQNGVDGIINNPQMSNKEKISALNEKYIVSSDKRDTEREKSLEIEVKRGIEVGHIFNFGDKYSKSMNLKIMNKEGKFIHPVMGSYGIGVGRLVAGFIEANHDDKGIIWNKTIAPFAVNLLNLTPKDESSKALCEQIYQTLESEGYEVLYDDTNSSVGEKFATADLLGIPVRVSCSKRLEGKLEVKKRTEDEPTIISPEALLEYVRNS